VGAHASDISDTLNFINRLEVNAVITVDLEPHKLIKELDRTGLPIVHTDTVNFMSGKPILIADHVQAGKLAASKLAELGHNNILFVDSFFEKTGSTSVTAEKRWRGIGQGADKHGIINIKRKAVTVRDEQRYGKVKKVIDDNAECTGIITQGHVMAHLIRHVVEKKKARFWKDKDLVVFGIQHHPYFIRDRAAWFCKWNGRDMGRTAVKYLMDKSLRPRIRHFSVFIENNLDVSSSPDDIYKV
jgi:DNA-binding LacI/PurR family transcriptional regulator